MSVTDDFNEIYARLAVINAKCKSRGIGGSTIINLNLLDIKINEVEETIIETIKKYPDTSVVDPIPSRSTAMRLSLKNSPLRKSNSRSSSRPGSNPRSQPTTSRTPRIPVVENNLGVNVVFNLNKEYLEELKIHIQAHT